MLCILKRNNIFSMAVPMLKALLDKALQRNEWKKVFENEHK